MRYELFFLHHYEIIRTGGEIPDLPLEQVCDYVCNIQAIHRNHLMGINIDGKMLVREISGAFALKSPACNLCEPVVHKPGRRLNMPGSQQLKPLNGKV